jgi:hypothetical protein
MKDWAMDDCGVLILLICLRLVHAKAVIDYLVVLINTTLHVRLGTAPQHTESGRRKQRGCNLSGSAHCRILAQNRAFCPWLFCKNFIAKASRTVKTKATTNDMGRSPTAPNQRGRFELT